MRVALAQMDQVWEDKEANKKICVRMARHARRRGADIIVFPEMTLTGYTISVAAMGEDERASGTMDFFRTVAKTEKIAILFGVIFLDTTKKRGRNMAVTIDAHGRVRATYQKVHPFSFACEDRYIVPGKELSFFGIQDLRCSVAVCYDLRFPGLFESIAEKKPDVIFVIANWGAARESHWRTLLCARALETQSYVVGVNRVGTGGGVAFSGSSLVYGPDGSIVLDAGHREGLYLATIDRRIVEETRKKFPTLRDKKFDL